MAVVNTNANASIAQNALARNERAMNTAMERLSTGQGLTAPPTTLLVSNWVAHDLPDTRPRPVFAMQMTRSA